MEVASETLAVSFKDELNFIGCDSSTTFEHLRQPLFKASVPGSSSGENNKSCLFKNTAALGNSDISELDVEEERTISISNYSPNEIANVCYAKMWRGTGSSFVFDDADNENYPCEGSSISSNFFEKDLDKLRKLRLKSSYKSRKYTEKKEVKKWVETPEKFIRALTDIRNERSQRASQVNANDSTKKTSQLPDSSDTKPFSASERSGNKWKNQVHFPEHVLLRAALQEGEPKEVERIIKDIQIDLNSLNQKTGRNYLHKAIANDQMNCAKMLIQNGIDVNQKDNHGISPLALAFRLMNLRMIALLVDSGANLSEYTNSRIEEMQKVKQLSCSISKVFEMDV